MQDLNIKEDEGELAARDATLKLSHTREGAVLTARVPGNVSHEEFGRVTASAFELVSKLTGHPCLSGRIKFVVEDMFLKDVIRVNLQTGRMG
jgi:hypothetical protein